MKWISRSVAVVAVAIAVAAVVVVVIIRCSYSPTLNVKRINKANLKNVSVTLIWPTAVLESILPNFFSSLTNNFCVFCW